MNNDKSVGESTAGERVKSAHRKFLNLIQSSKHGTHVSLKAFARNVAENGDDAAKQNVKDWLECKAGALNSSRSDLALKRITEQRLAKRAIRSSKKK